MNLDSLSLYDLDDKPCGKVMLPPSETPRTVIWRGRRFVEGGPDSIYPHGEMGEVRGDAQ